MEKSRFSNPEESIREIGGVKIISTRRDVIYYMIRFAGGSIPEGSYFPGFGDPHVYGYDLGAPLYTNILTENRVPDSGARWWALSEPRISFPGIRVDDLVPLITSLVFKVWIAPGGGGGDRLDLFKAPLLSLRSVEGVGLERINYVPGANTFAREVLHTKPIPSVYPVGCELRAGKDFLLEEAVDGYVVLEVIYFYARKDKRAAREPAKAMSGPSGVRFAVEVMDQINQLVDSGAVSSKSEYIRNAVDEALVRDGGGS